MYADAPIDRYARGERNALSERTEARRACSSSARAGCVQLPRRVAGASNEMFSDFREHVIGVPQVAPSFGNVTFDGPGANEDFGLEQVTGRAGATATRSARPRCGTSRSSRRSCTTARSCGSRTPSATTSTRRRPRAPTRPATSLPICADRPVPIAPVLERLDPRLRHPQRLSDGEFGDLVDFVRDGLLDPAAAPARLRRLVPERLPSGRTPLRFEFP